MLRLRSRLTAATHRFFQVSSRFNPDSSTNIPSDLDNVVLCSRIIYHSD